MVGGRNGLRVHSTPSSAQHPAVTTNNVTGHASATRTVIYFLKNKTNLSLSFGREVGKEGVGKGAVLLLLQRERGHGDTQIKEIKKQNKTRNPKTWKRRHSKLYRYTIHC